MRKIFPSFFLFFLLACGGKQTPTGVLPEDKMVLILADLQLADAATRSQLMPEDYVKHPEKTMLDITAAYGTDTTTFGRSMRWYVRHPEKLKAIYTKVNEQLMQKSNAQ